MTNEYETSMSGIEEWQSMDSAPTDGKHVLLAVKSSDGCFIYHVQDAFMQRKWYNAANILNEPLCWRPLTKIPNDFLPEGFRQ